MDIRYTRYERYTGNRKKNNNPNVIPFELQSRIPVLMRKKTNAAYTGIYGIKFVVTSQLRQANVRFYRLTDFTILQTFIDFYRL